MFGSMGDGTSTSGMKPPFKIASERVLRSALTCPRSGAPKIRRHRGMGAAMKAGIALLTSVVVCGNALAGPAQYAVDGLAIGTLLNFSSSPYRDYKCSRSEQFSGLTWCQRTGTYRERQKSYTAAYSLLHSRDGKIVYVNRSQNSSFFKSNEAEEDIQRYSSRIGETPQTLKMPPRRGLPDGLIAFWGQITLVQLDDESVKLLSGGRNPKKGLLVDFLGDFVRSAKEGLPIYRIGGGPGFVWMASFDQKGRGTHRLLAIDASELPSMALAPQPTFKPDSRTDLQPASQPVEGNTEEDLDQFESSQMIESLKRELATASAMIAELERTKIAAEADQIAADEARLAADAARNEIEQVRATEKATADERIARLELDRVAYDKNHHWEGALYGSLGGLLVMLISSTIGFFWKQQKTWKSATKPIEVSTRSQSSTAAIEADVLSPTIAIAEDAFGRELENQVAVLNTSQRGLTARTDHV